MTNPVKHTSAQFEARPRQSGVAVALLVTCLFMLAGYLLLRYGGRWGESDAGMITQAIQNMLEDGSLLPVGGVTYPNGYGYQALSVFILQVGGISSTHLQLYLQLFLMPWIVLPAWLLYRELTGSERGATLAAVILLVQPEFLFALLRGTHEKFTRGLILMALYLFVKSLRQSQHVRRLAGSILAFYLAALGFITFNNLLSFSFIVAMVLAIALLAGLRWWTHSPTPAGPAAENRLRYAVLTASILVFLFTFYFYPPARSNILVLENMTDRTAALVLDVETTSDAAPYAYTAGAWLSGWVYLAVSIATWVLLGISALIWSCQTVQLLKRRNLGWQPDQVMLWAFYGAFGIQGAFSIVVDFSGALASNLQLRVFPAFALLAAPVVARAFLAWYTSGRRFQRAAWAVLATSLGIMGVLSVFKATNEPLVSNKWHFYIPAEMHALDRSATLLKERTLWTEWDERLLSAYNILHPFEKTGEYLQAWAQPAQNVLVSEVILARQARTFLAPPVQADSLLVYDNGQAQIYHHRPRTPFQH